MHSTKNVNETHSSQFLMETSLDLGIRRWREMGSPSYTPPREKRKKKSLQDAGGSDSSEEKGKENCVG